MSINEPNYVAAMRIPLVRIAVWFVAAVGLMFVLTSSVLIVFLINWDVQACQVEGEVVELRKYVGTSSAIRRPGPGHAGRSQPRSRPGAKATVVYQVDGKEYRTIARYAARHAPSVGGNIQLQYLPKQPGKAKPQKPRTLGYVISFASLVVGCTLLIVPILFLKSSHQPNDSLQQ